MPRLIPDRRVRTTTSPGPGSGSVDGPDLAATGLSQPERLGDSVLDGHGAVSARLCHTVSSRNYAKPPAADWRRTCPGVAGHLWGTPIFGNERSPGARSTSSTGRDGGGALRGRREDRRARGRRAVGRALPRSRDPERRWPSGRVSPRRPSRRSTTSRRAAWKRLLRNLGRASPPNGASPPGGAPRPRGAPAPGGDRGVPRRRESLRRRRARARRGVVLASAPGRPARVPRRGSRASDRPRDAPATIVDRATAARRVDANDRARRDYVKEAYGDRRRRSALYHLMIDAVSLGVDVCVDLIVAASESRVRRSARRRRGEELGMLRPRETPTRERKSLERALALRARRRRRGPRGGLVDERPLAGSREMPVPASFNDVFADAEAHDHVGDVWYQTVARVPERWRGERIVLRFDSATHRAVVWVGRDAGRGARGRLHAVRGGRHRRRRAGRRGRGSPRS